MSAPFHDPSLNRREFLIRSAKAGALVVTAGALGAWLHDPDGPARPSAAAGADAAAALADFSHPGLGSKLSIVTGEDREKTVMLALQSLGGMESFIQRGDRVLIKVNAAFALPPMLSATTHPLLVATVTRMCLKAGAASVVVTDNPINDARSCFALTGIDQAARTAGARVILPQDSLFKPTTLAGAQYIRNWPLLSGPFQGINRVIGIAPVKDHHRSGASMTMKNWYGLLGGRRNIFHQDIHNLIKELALLVRPTLVILDGTTAMMTNGPTGGSLSDLKATHTMIVGTDQVAVDACGASLLGKTAADLPYLLKAQSAGAGTADYESLAPIRASVS